MRTIGTLCALLLCAAFVTAQETGSAPPQNVASATGPSYPVQPQEQFAPPPLFHPRDGTAHRLARRVARSAGYSAQQAQIHCTRSAAAGAAEAAGFEWLSPAMEQWAAFLTWRRSVRLFQEKTHNQLGGPFWSDYVRSLEGLHGWWDGDSYATNLRVPSDDGRRGRLHPGSQRTRRALVEFSRSRRPTGAAAGEGFAASAIYSLQFELGPISEASIGNVGLKPGTMAWVDLLVTPLADRPDGRRGCSRPLVIAKAERRLGKTRRGSCGRFSIQTGALRI